MKKFRLFLTGLLLVLTAGLTYAQNKQVTGTVTDAGTGEPVAYASVQLKGTMTGTTTDESGKFTINAPGNGTLIISFIGYTTVEVAVNNQAVVNVAISPDAVNLEDVVVVAYGTAKKSAFTGSASTVKGTKLAERAVSNVTNALAGQVAGVQITSNNGQPGSAATVRIRGVGSMSASNAPLYVVDGVPYDGTISAINPQDIESITVLKDAASSALYGARGANGIILLTTKKATSKDAIVTFEAKWGNNSRAIPNYSVMTDPAMYYETLYRALYNAKAYNGSSAAASYAYADAALLDDKNGGVGYMVYTVPSGEKFIGTNFKMNPNASLGYSDGEYYYTPDDWYAEIFNKGNLRSEYNFSVAGSTDKLNAYMSAGYLDDSGLVSGSGFQRFTSRVKLDYQAKEWLKIGVNSAYTYYDSQSPGSQTSWGSSGNLFYVTNMISPIYPMYVRNADGTIKVDNRGITVYDFGGSSTNFTRSFMALSNPAITLKLDKHHAYTDVVNTKWYATANLLEGLQFTATLSANVRNQRENHLYNQFYGGSVGSEGAVSVSHYREFGVNQQYLLTYKKKIATNHNIDLFAGYESYNLKLQDLGGSNSKLYNPFVGELNNAIQTPPSVYSYTNEYSLVGLLARAQYDYKEKYFLSASYRRDGSSRFHPDSRWGNFGSIGGAWLISKENFMSSVNWIDLLKLKASYGSVGNDNIGNYYAYLDQFNVSNSNGDYSVSFAYKGNKDITWETSYALNAGVEFELFGSKLNGSVEFFHRNTVDQLYNQPVPVSLGYSSIPMNIGSIVNRGVELELNGTLLKTDKILWTANFNATHYKNEITDLAETPKAAGGIKGTNYIYRIGGSLYNSYLRKWAGVDPQTGKSIYYIDPDKGDMNTTDDYSKAAQSDLGSTLAKVYGGFGTSINAYGFDLSIQLSYQLGGKLYDGSYEQLMHQGDDPGNNWSMDILKAWTPENPSTKYPRLDASIDTYQKQSSRFLTSSDYLSFNSVMLGYTLPKNLIKSLKLSNARIYVSGDNLGVISARKGLDPRQSLGLGSSTTSGNYSYSAMRTISAGITLSF
jgi:Outer membrane receptor for ferrienterochelin and colicins